MPLTSTILRQTASKNMTVGSNFGLTKEAILDMMKSTQVSQAGQDVEQSRRRKPNKKQESS
jgi:hypothetical protein